MKNISQRLQDVFKDVSTAEMYSTLVGALCGCAIGTERPKDQLLSDVSETFDAVLAECESPTVQ